MTFSFTQVAFQLIVTVLRDIGLPGLFALMAVESFGIPPLPSEVILPLSGVLIVDGAYAFTWPTVVIVAVAGGVVGAVAAYEVGRWGGPAIVHRWGKRLRVSEADIVRAERFFATRGPVTVGVARLIPILRAYISYPAGAASMDRVQFAAYTALGATPFTVALVYLGTVLGANYGQLEPYFQVLDVLAIVAIALALVWYFAVRPRRRTAPPPSEPTAAGP